MDITAIRSAESLGDLAGLINLRSKDLSYILYKLNGGREYQYKEFKINKKNGGQRTISTPTTALKEVQKRVIILLSTIFYVRPCVHGFIKKKSIITNAERHVNKKYVLNVDLNDFFPSINFGRVRGLLIAKPYELHTNIATIIAQIACYKNALPQGSPCSPIISNMICSKMDRELINLAKKCKCLYSRYSDDLTFSTNEPLFPTNICDQSNGKAEPGDDLKIIIEGNWFSINNNKFRLQTKTMRQEVTGLTVNKFVNVKRKLIRQVRAMLYAWEKWGLEAAENEHYEKYNNKSRNTEGKFYKSIVRGKIEFIRMVRSNNKRLQSNRRRLNNYQKSPESDDVYHKFLKNYYELELREGNLPIIRTEGQTDWKHLSAAWREIRDTPDFDDIEIDFFKSKNDVCYGYSNLYTFCRKAKKYNTFGKKIICVFDNDIDFINKKHKNSTYYHWGNNVYSFVIPTPKRHGDNPISIEFYYSSKTIATKNEKGRRLFLNTEFDSNGIHKKCKKIEYGINPKTGRKIKNWSSILSGKPKIIDSKVFKTRPKLYSLALSKNEFAENILRKRPRFENVNFHEFKKIFSIIKTICKL